MQKRLFTLLYFTSVIGIGGIEETVSYQQEIKLTSSVEPSDKSTLQLSLLATNKLFNVNKKLNYCLHNFSEKQP